MAPSFDHHELTDHSGCWNSAQQNTRGWAPCDETKVDNFSSPEISDEIKSAQTNYFSKDQNKHNFSWLETDFRPKLSTHILTSGRS